MKKSLVLYNVNAQVSSLSIFKTTSKLQSPSSNRSYHQAVGQVISYLLNSRFPSIGETKLYILTHKQISKHEIHHGKHTFLDGDQIDKIL